jgi:hypothetical protein
MLAGEKRRLFDLRKDVFRISIEFKIPYLDQREVAFWPNLGQVEGIERKGLRLGIRHHLDEERPAREIASFDASEEIPLMALAVLPTFVICNCKASHTNGWLIMH